MRSRFRETLENKYGEIVKDAARLGELKEEGEDVTDLLAELESVFNWAIEKAVKARRSSEGAQKEILRIQIKKQEVMRELKANIRALDEEHEAESQEAEPGSYLVKQEGGVFVRVEEDGTENRITKGEILTDGEWGLEYTLDPETVPRGLRKRYLIEAAKQKLQDYLDEQIIIDEISSEFTDKRKRETYARVLRGRETGEYETLPGLVAERLVKNFFKKLCYDFDLPMEIIEADIFQDVEQKVDFIIHLLLHYRGVGVEEAKEGDVGVQFTTSKSKESLRKKEKQVRTAKDRIARGEEKYVEDIVLVNIPMREAADTYEEWVANGRPPGGPDKAWSWQFKKQVFEGVLNGMLSPDEITDEWRKIRQGSTRKGDVKLPEPINIEPSARKKMKRAA